MNQDNFVKIASAGSTAEAEQIVRHLTDHGIPSYRQSGIIDIYMGNSTAGEDVMVAKEDQEPARKSMEDFRPIKTNAGGYGPKFSKGQRVMGWILLIVIVLCILVPLFFI